MKHATRLLADLIADDFLRSGAGNLNPTFDQLTRAWQDLTEQSLDDSKDFIARRWRLAVKMLDEHDAWSVWVPYTITFKTLSFAEPDDTDWPRLLACVAGQGGQSAAVGIHFHIPADSNCWMWMVWRDFYDKVGNGAKEAAKENIERVATDVLQPSELTAAMSERRRSLAKKDAKDWQRIGKGPAE